MSMVRLWCPETLEDMEIWRAVARRWKPSGVLMLSLLKRSAWKSDQWDAQEMLKLSHRSVREVIRLRHQSCP
jgi:hypothetical protein